VLKEEKKEKTWKSKLEIEGQRLKEHTVLTEGMEWRDLDVIIQNINRVDCPIILDTTTEGYIGYSEQYYRALPVDWISCDLKPLKKVAETHKNFDRQKKSTECHF